MQIVKLLLAGTLVSFAGYSTAAEPVDIGERLPPRVRGLLQQEMKAILDASKTILEALVRGQDEVVAEHAQAIHDSFILQQKMTAADKQALLEAAPEDFIQRDKAFHALSARLAEAARQGQKTRQRELFAKVQTACLECHTSYASGRFPGFKE